MKVKVDYPNRPKDSDVDIVGLGTFKNGSTETVEDERWERFLKYDSHANEYVGDQKTQVTFPYEVPELEPTETPADTSGTANVDPTTSDSETNDNKNKKES